MKNFENKDKLTQKEALGNEEINPEKIRQLFNESPSEKVELMASNLARPDGFAKTIILGQIMTSAELARAISPEFVKTHRGYYHSFPPSHYHQWGENDYLSFNVGKTQRRYQESSSKKSMRNWNGGLGFAIPAGKILKQDGTIPTWGGFEMRKVIKALKDSPLSEKQFEKYYGLTEEQCWDIDRVPQKGDFLTLVHMARKAGTLNSGDQAEVNIHPERETMPRIRLDTAIILIPAKNKEAFKMYLSKKLKEITPFAEKIKNLTGIDTTSLDADKILDRYHNIYWYPQENIELAVEYLSAHKDKIVEFSQKESPR